MDCELRLTNQSSLKQLQKLKYADEIYRYTYSWELFLVDIYAQNWHYVVGDC